MLAMDRAHGDSHGSSGPPTEFLFLCYEVTHPLPVSSAVTTTKNRLKAIYKFRHRSIELKRYLKNPIYHWSLRDWMNPLG